MRRKSLSMVIVLTLILAMTNQIILARDYKDSTSDEYRTNFEMDLENHPDIDLNQRNYLKVDYYQTKVFNDLNPLNLRDVPDDSNWELFKSDVLKAAFNAAGFTTESAMPLGYMTAVFNEATDINSVTGLPNLTSPYGKKIVAKGFFVPTTSGNYTIGAISDEGLRLTFDGRVYDANWAYTGSGDHSYSVGSLTAGMIYPIKLEYFENQEKGANFTLVVNGMTSEDIKGYFYPRLNSDVNYTLEVLVNQIGGLENNAFVDYKDVVDFNEMVDSTQTNFKANRYSNSIVIGNEYNLNPLHVDGYTYEIYHRIVEMVPVVGSEVLQTKVTWALMTNESDEFPYITGQLLKNETYAVNYTHYEYRVEFFVHPNDMGKGTVSLNGDFIMERDAVKVVTATPSSGYEFDQWYGEFEVPATPQEIATAKQSNIAVVRHVVILPITDITKATSEFVADGSLTNTSGELQKMDRYLVSKEFVYTTKIFAGFKLKTTPSIDVDPDETTPEADPVLDADLVDDELPKAGGVPIGIISLIGGTVLGLGLILSKRK